MNTALTHEDAEPSPHPEAETAVAREDSVLALADPPAELAHYASPEPTGAEADTSPPDADHAEPVEPGEPADILSHRESGHDAAPPDEQDETTTIVLATPVEEDEPTTLLLAPVEVEDEPTTIVRAEAVEDEEVTTFLPAQPTHDVEDATTLVPADCETIAATHPASPEYDADESTTLVQAVPEAGDEEPTTLMTAPPEPPQPTVTQAATQAQDDSVTEIRHAALPGGAGQGAPDWFIENLQHFTQALRLDATGATRPPQEVQQLALAARDMIARVAMQGGARATAEGWTGDTVLQPDQLLANTYIVRSLIARGGIGEIYRTRHRDLKTEHAVKVLLPRYALDPTVLTLMQDEARLLACVRHEAVVRCQDLLRDADGRPMLVMDFLRGRTLSARLREGRLATADLVVLARRLAEGLTAIHAAGIIHQDISPDNVILADDSCGAATIIDFGLARRVGTGRDMHRNLDFAGKYSWSSPEQLSGRPAAVDARSDLYSLGLMLAAAARGYRLDMGQDLESARAARTTVPSLAGIEQPLAGLIEALLAPSPDARLGSATDIEPMLEPRPRSLWERIAPYLGLKASS